MRYVIRVATFTDFNLRPPLWVESYDPDAYDGRGHVVLTQDISQALPFLSRTAAREYWRKQSKRKPWRDDGKPNRPLTAWSVEIEPVEIDV